MWRKFLGVGIPVLVVGVVFLIIGWHTAVDYAFSYEMDYYYDGGGAGALIWVGYILAIIGGMLLNAGLIGAAVGADPRTRALAAQAAAMPQPVNPAPPAPGFVQAAVPSGVRFCAGCGGQNLPSSGYCLQCGAELGPLA